MRANEARPTDPTLAGKPGQFLYVLRLVPRLRDETAWTDADHAAIGRHFAYLQTAAGRGQVILAGRTTEPLDRTFGLVVFEAADEAAACAFMAADPAVAAKIMTPELHPYRVAVRGG
ncbi:MAG: YciI family protein [Opitutaceae bacterium]|jgi:uncharacterized protein YciI